MVKIMLNPKSNVFIYNLNAYTVYESSRLPCLCLIKLEQHRLKFNGTTPDSKSFFNIAIERLNSTPIYS